MATLELLYDHFKETVKLNSETQGKRNKLFVVLCLFEILSFIMLLFPDQMTDGLIEYAKTQYGVGIEVGIPFFQCAIWIAVTYLSVRYFQTMIYVERLYKYIAILEKEISTRLECAYFDRESNSYLENYPKALDLVHVFYTWAIPVLMIFVNFLKIAYELHNGMRILSGIFDAVCCFFCTALSVLYLVFMHPMRSKK